MQEEDSIGKLLLEVRCTYKELLEAVNNVCTSILEKMTIEEYKIQWVLHDFPLKNSRNIQELLNRYNKSHL